MVHNKRTLKNTNNNEICILIKSKVGYPGGASGKGLACQCRRHKRRGFNLWVEMIPWRRAWPPIPVFLSGESHGKRNLVGYQSIGLRLKPHD